MERLKTHFADWSSDSHGRIRALVEHGWAGFMRRLRPWFVLCRIHVRSTAVAAPDEQMLSRYPVRQASRDELLRAAEDMPQQLSIAFIDAALARGDFCVAAFDGDRMIAFGWVAFARAPNVPGLAVVVAPPYRYGYKIFTHPDYRGQRIINAVQRVRDRLSLAQGRTMGVAFVESHNFAYIRAERRIGSELVGFAGYLHLFGRYWPFRSPGVLRHNFRFTREEDD